MFTYQQHKTIALPVAHVFNLIIDVPSYPDFLPWCKAVRIKRKFQNAFIADMVVGPTTGLRERFTSKVTFDPMQGVVTSTAIEGPFSTLHTKWTITPSITHEPINQANHQTLMNQTTLKNSNNNACHIHFDIEFDFRSALLAKLFGPFFENITVSMMEAFEKRAFELAKNQGI